MSQDPLSGTSPATPPDYPPPGSDSAGSQPQAPATTAGEETGTAPTPPLPPNLPLATRLPVLEYHYTEFKMGKTIQMKTEWFLAQMDWLGSNGYQTLTGDELLRFVHGEYQPPQKSFVLRFDLGQPADQNYREIIIPALEKYHFHAIFFLLTNMVKDTCDGNYICWSQIQAWEQAGTIEVGSHGVYHPDYQKLSLEARRWDARHSKQVIESKLGHPISFFAFPYDSVPTRPDLLLKPLGYTLAFAGYRTERSVLLKDATPYSLPCYYVYSGESTYPVVTGTNGLTFGQMIDKAVAIK